MDLTARTLRVPEVWIAVIKDKWAHIVCVYNSTTKDRDYVYQR